MNENATSRPPLAPLLLGGANRLFGASTFFHSPSALSKRLRKRSTSAWRMPIAAAAVMYATVRVVVGAVVGKLEAADLLRRGSGGDDARARAQPREERRA